jgi:arylsulfatase A-like enzyme
MSRLSLGLFCLALLAAPVVAGDATKDRPNILVILADDLGYADVGFHGCKDIPTPHLDALAKAGVRCTSGYVSGPYCSPTRAGLLTGRYQQRYGHEFNPGPATEENRDKGLPLTETTLATRLKAVGYRTGLVGKWHLGNAEKMQPPQRGFDEFFGFLGGANPYLAEARAVTMLRGSKKVEEKEYLTDAFAREALAFIDRNKGKPFFLYLAFNAVHRPMHATEKYLARFKDIKDKDRRTYAAMLSAMDDAVGAVMARLRKEGLEEKTLVFFLSDNGGPPQANASRNTPLRGRKATTWEGGIRVPFVVHWKGKLEGGRTYDRPVIQLDIVPTALAAAGVAMKPDWKLDGVDLLPFLKGEKKGDPHEALYWRFGAQMAVRLGDWKLVKAPAPDAKMAAARRGEATVKGAQLYNLAEDIGESTNVAARNPEKVKELAAAWEKWNATLVKPAWGPPLRKKGN